MLPHPRAALTFLLPLLAGAALGPVAAAQTPTPTAPQSATNAPQANSPHADTRAVKEWNLDRKTRLAIAGYDPVAYFPEGGAAPRKGDAANECEYQGAVYRFATRENLERFKANPARYEPAHGGWCAWAMREGDKVEVDPRSFIVKDDRLFLFYNGLLADTRAKWLKGDHAAEAKMADAKWKSISHEDPRMAPQTQANAAADALQPKLDAVWTRATSQLPAEKAQAFERGMKEVADSGAVERALAFGHDAPAFTLMDSGGKEVSLSSMLAKGPVVLTWYRGSWCPFCVVQLREYQRRTPEFQAAGAQLVAISPQTVKRSRELVDKAGLSFPVLSDPGNAAARSYGLAYAVPAAAKMDLSQYNGDTSGELPLAATYVIAPSGKVVYAFVSADYRTRAEPSDILAAVKAAMQPELK